MELFKRDITRILLQKIKHTDRRRAGARILKRTAKAEEEQLNKVFASLPKKQQEKLKSKAIKNFKQEYSNISPRVFDSIIATRTMIMIKVREMLKKKPSIGKIEKEAAKKLEEVFGDPGKVWEIKAKQ
ncbi:hypothetical protein M1M93_00505 [Thermodesulfovibrionales bacterium]|nr:hypothetical protein [Thermodesulfovibrionales bacterium]MCL0033511.1 hypothetical protein [Thermodesulfovibrionales bacterium]